MELKDEEIKKALECCVNGQCEDCPFYTRCFKHESVATIALDLINRQQAEIEKLENAIIALMSYLDILGADKTDTSFINQATEFNKQIRADIKSEAIKEFAERLKKEAVTKCDWDNCVDVEDIDRLVAEMAGKENA